MTMPAADRHEVVADLAGVFGKLQRRPDVEAPNLTAVDAADRLILDVARDDVCAFGASPLCVIGDNYGALTLGALTLRTAGDMREVRVHQDALTREQAIQRNAQRLGLSGRFELRDADAGLTDRARVVLMRLPRSLGELSELADLIARNAAPDVVVYAGGRDKHITPAMNDVLAGYFETVQPGLGRQKSRVITARGIRAELAPVQFPVRAELPGTGLTVVAHGAVFAGAKLDIGTRFLLDYLPHMRAADSAVDLGCGTGVLAAALARAQPQTRVLATDVSAAAVASATATMRANGLTDRVQVRRDDGLSQVADASVDLIVCNPPFHVGAGVHVGAALRMIREAGRVLRPGGELWTVYNSHLQYRAALGKFVGATDIVGRNRKFTVSRSVR